MEQHNFVNIARIIEISDPEQVNEHLAHGWQLLSTRSEVVVDNQQRTIYVLGLPRSKAESSPDRSQAQRNDTTFAPTPPRQAHPKAKSPPSSQANNPPPHDTQDTTAQAAPLSWRLQLDEQPRRSSRRRKAGTPEKTYTPTEEQLREQAAWKQVQETGKPVLFEGHWLMPSGMSPWEAIELLPDGIREETRAAMQERVAHAFVVSVEHMRKSIREQFVERGEAGKFDALPYAAQAALAESIVRKQWGWPDEPLEDLVRHYAGQREGPPTD